MPRSPTSRTTSASYIGTDFGSLYAGSIAKTLLAVVAHGGDPTDFGGHDLVEELQAAEGAVEPGRFSDLPVDCGFDPCDYSNTIGQSLAIIALLRAGEGRLRPRPWSFLLAQQCGDGGFRDLDGRPGVHQRGRRHRVRRPGPDRRRLGCRGGRRARLARRRAGRRQRRLRQRRRRAEREHHGRGRAGLRRRRSQHRLADAQASSSRSSTTAPPRRPCAAASRSRRTTGPAPRRLGTPTCGPPRRPPWACRESRCVSVTAEGSSSGTRPCPAPRQRASPTRRPPASDSTSAPTEAAGGSDPSSTVEASSPGALAQTGSDLLLPALLGLALVVIGGVAVFASTRRRGAHA